MISSGLYDERVAVLRPVVTKDGFGAQRQTWQAVRTTWARVQWKRGAHALDSGESWHPETLAVTMRWRTDLSPRMRLGIGGKLYKIESLNGSYSAGEATMTVSLVDEPENA